VSFNVDGIGVAVTEARAKAAERKIKFEQSFDLCINFRKKEMDVSKPENRLNQDLQLPNMLFPPVRVCAFGDGDFAERAKSAGVERVVSKEDIPKVGEQKSERKGLAKTFDFFIASTDTMPLVGRYLGQALGSRGKMPRPTPPQADLGAVVAQYQRTVRIRMKNTPTLHVKIGHEKMTDEQVAQNIAAVLSFIHSKGHADKIGNLVVKMTMGPAIDVTDWR
jgi:large subunit ribosomal protein L1